MAGSGLPERLAALLLGGLDVKADVAQQVRVKVAQPLAVTAAGKGGHKGAGHAGGKASVMASAVTGGEKGGFGPGHDQLLRFVLIQLCVLGRHIVVSIVNESPEEHCDRYKLGA